MLKYPTLKTLDQYSQNKADKWHLKQVDIFAKKAAENDCEQKKCDKDTSEQEMAREVEDEERSWLWKNKKIYAVIPVIKNSKNKTIRVTLLQIQSLPAASTRGLNSDMFVMTCPFLYNWEEEKMNSFEKSDYSSKPVQIRKCLKCLIIIISLKYIDCWCIFAVYLCLLLYLS